MTALRSFTRSAFVVAALAVSGTAGFAQTARQTIRIAAAIADDPAHTLTWTEHRETTPLSPAVLRGAAQIEVATREGLRAEILVARTVKADGRRLDLAPGEFATRVIHGSTPGSVPPVSVQHAEFPDLGLGDTAVLEVRYVESRHSVPDQISWSSNVLPDGSQVDIEVRLDAPSKLAISHFERGGFVYTQADVASDRIRRTWSGTFSVPASDEKNVADPQRRLPAYAFSTFEDYEALGRAYGRGVMSASEPGPVIAQLAKLITADAHTTESKVAAVFSWVQRQIRSSPADLAANPYVPNAPDKVVGRGSGDCKDKATLFTALLGALDIGAEQVLVSSGNAFDLPGVPLMQAFDHVIAYVPDLNRYLDPTLALATFRHLPEALAGKPVVRVARDGSAIVAAIPVGTPGENEARLRTRLAIDGDGMLHAFADLEAGGDLSEQVARFLGIVQTKGSDRAVADLVNFRSMPGKASLVDRPAAAASGWARVATDWSSATLLPTDGTAWRVPEGLSPMVASLKLFLNTGSDKPRTLPVLCRPGRIIQEDEITWAPGIELRTASPTAVEVSIGPFTVRRSWTVAGRTLFVRSEAVSTVAERRCSADLANALHASMTNGAAGLNPPLVFGRTTAQ